MATLTWSSVSAKTWDSENTSTWDNPSGTSTDVNIVSVVSNTTTLSITPVITVVRNINIGSVLATLTAQAKIPRLVLNASEIIGQIELIGSRDLYIYLKGSRELNVNLKGGL